MLQLHCSTLSTSCKEDNLVKELLAKITVLLEGTFTNYIEYSKLYKEYAELLNRIKNT